MTNKERRQAVRAPAKLAMEIKLGGGVAGASAETINVSANGVYFSANKHIPPLTKLQITLMLPDADGASAKEVVCDGIVVRVEPEEPQASKTTYEIACYFTSISEKDREGLETYILSQLAF